MRGDPVLPRTGEGLQTVPSTSSMNIVAFTALLWGLGAMAGTPRFATLVGFVLVLILVLVLVLPAIGGSGRILISGLTDCCNL